MEGHPPKPVRDISIASSPAHKARDILGAFALLALIGWIDYITGYEINVFVLYFLPIAWITWSGGLLWGISLSVLSCAVWFWANIGEGHHYTHLWIGYERAGNTCFIMLFISYSFHTFKKNLGSKTKKVKQLTGILPICIACNRIRGEKGEWTDLDSYLRQHSDALPEPLVCPDCSGARYR